MTTEHVVAPGEDLPSIVHRHAPGHTVDDVLALPENRALASLRANRILAPGDRVRLPTTPPPAKTVKKTTPGHYRFVVNLPSKALCVCLRLPNGDPIAGANYTLRADSFVGEGATDADGWIRERVPVDLTAAVIHVGGRQFSLRIGSLDPASRPTGVQSRLRNLGYRPGPADGKFGPHTARALAKFQQDHGLPMTGVCDADTRALLISEHGG